MDFWTRGYRVSSNETVIASKRSSLPRFRANATTTVYDCRSLADPVQQAQTDGKLNTLASAAVQSIVLQNNRRLRRHATPLSLDLR